MRRLIALMMLMVVSAFGKSKAPNIVFILADDQGWNALSTRMDPNDPGSGSTYYQTPNLAKLAAEGMRFSQAYSPAPTCSPTRHSIQFGRSPASLKIFGADGINDWDAGSNESLAHVLKSINPDYVCAHLGKWHIGRGPDELGYDVHEGSKGNKDGNDKSSGDDPKKIFSLSRDANTFMEKQAKAGKPFYLQISHYADHLAYQALPETIKEYETEHVDKATEYQNSPLWAAMNENLDVGVGMVLDKIKELGIADNTYIIYTADNGYEAKTDFGKPVHERGYYKAYPQRSHKYHVSEGGIRVPFIVRGPGIPANTHSTVPVVGTDVFATVMDIAGGADRIPERVEGASLLAHVKSGGAKPVQRKDPFLVFKFSKPRPPHDATIVRGDYKLMKDIDTGRIFLFNLKEDIGESKNLADAKPELAKRMYADMTTYFKRFGWDESQINKKSAKKPGKAKGGKKKKAGSKAPASVPVAASYKSSPNDILIADFEGETYGGWKATGDAFGDGPALSGGKLANKVTGYQGRGLVNTFLAGDKSTGTLTSPEFTIERKCINFLIGAGNHDGKTCMNLLAAGKVVRTATGPATKDGKLETMQWVSWDVAEFAGKKATLQIVDNHMGGWGHINVDHIVQSDQSTVAATASAQSLQKADGTLLLDYQSGKQPPADWKVEGYAFGSHAPNEKEKQKAAVASPNQRQYQFGKMVSPEFTINADYLEVQCGGICHPERCTVRLVVDGRDVRGCSVGSHWFDVRDLEGKKAVLEVRDNHFNGWFDQVSVTATSRKPPVGANVVISVPDWVPDRFETVISGEYLLLPLADGNKAPLQEVAIEIDGQEKLAADFPLAFGDTPIAGYLPVYDLTAFQGKKLKVLYHRLSGREPAKVLLKNEMPERDTSDKVPAFHVHCRFGRLNDPNGLCYLNGVYHLYYQYTYGIRGKLWAHSVSTDLMHWEERPIGLFPDQLGSMHSGSGAVDVMNTSGWQKGDIPPVIAAFTGSRGMGGSDKIQMQGIAYSQDGGMTFAKYKGNPVVGTDEIYVKESDHARDPKIFWFSPTKGRDPLAKDGYWVMVLFEGTAHSIYTSDNLKDWKRHGEVNGFHECPELFPLAVDGDPKNVKWIMYGANGEYHIGTFDGKTYKPETKGKIPMNRGGRFYAAQTFNNTPMGKDGQPRRIQVAWQGSQISIATELTLRTTPLGLRVCMLPVEEISNLYARTVKLDGIKLKTGDANPLANLKSGLYDIELEADLSAAKQLEFDIRGNKLVVDVAKSTMAFGKKKVVLPDAKKLVLRIVVDNTSSDVYAGDHGLFHLPALVKQETKGLGLEVKGAAATFKKLRVHELKSIW